MPAVEPPAPAAPSRLVPGCLAVVGGAIAGSVLCAILFLCAASAAGFLRIADARMQLALATLIVVVVGLAGFALVIRSGKKRDVIIQVFLISTLVTALGAFATCSSLYWTMLK
jgi:hypothetical protein